MKFIIKFIIVLCILAFVGLILFVLFLAGFKPIDIFAKTGFNISGKDIVFEKIEKSEFCPYSNKETKEPEILLENYLVNPQSLSSYIHLKGKTYTLIPFNLNNKDISVTSYYPIFDYGILLVNGFYLDLNSNRMSKLGGAFAVYGSDDKKMVVYYDDLRYAGDGSYFKEINFVLFTKDGLEQRVLKYIYSDITESIGKKVFSGAFWKDNTFYFELNDGFYSLSIPINNLKKENIFYRNFKDPLINRDVSKKTYIEKLDLCDNDETCITVTALEENDISQCEVLQNQDKKDDCFQGFAILRDDPSICSRIKRNYKNEICSQQSFVKKSQSDPSLCEKFNKTFLQDMCYQDAALFQKKPQLCHNLKGKSIQECYIEIAKRTNDINVCNQFVGDPEGDLSLNPRFSCFEAMAIKDKNINICDNIIPTSRGTRSQYNNCRKALTQFSSCNS